MGRISEEQTATFVELFQAMPCLWNVVSPEYHRKDLRQAALRRISVDFEEAHDQILTGGW